MSALTQKASGRLALLIMGAGIVLAMLAITLLPADAADNPTPVGPFDRNADVCRELSIPVDDYDVIIPRSGTSTYSETIALPGGGSLTLFSPPNRSYVEFSAEDTYVAGGILFNRDSKRSGNFYDWSTAPVTSGVLEPPPRDNGNEKLAIFCLKPKADPQLATLATQTAAVGDVISDTATLTQADSPTGDVSFELYRGESCADRTLVTTLTGSLTVDSSDPTKATATAGYPVPSGGEGTYFWVASYAGDSNNNGVSGECGDEGETTVVYETAFFCGTSTEETQGNVRAFLIRPDNNDDPGCRVGPDDPKFGNLSIDGNVVSFDPSLGEGQAKFIAELTFPVTQPVASYQILQIEYDLTGTNFQPMRWYDTLAGPVSRDANGDPTDADFTCPDIVSGIEDWCILEIDIQRDEITFTIGGSGVDPKWKF